MEKELIESLKDKTWMKEQGLFIIDTEKVLDEALAAGFKVRHFLYCEEGVAVYERFIKKVSGLSVRVKPNVIKKLAGVKSNSGFIAVLKAEGAAPSDMKGAVVLLDNIQDPANLGAIIRSGTAFGFSKYLLRDTAGIYSEKTVRASAGNVFRAKFAEISINDAGKLKKTHKFYVTDVSGGTDVKQAAAKAAGDYVLVLGSEGRGVHPDLLGMADVKLHIPLKSTVESLNVAAAAAVIFYIFSKNQ
jgi:TrmH family RNA methyltransferase